MRRFIEFYNLVFMESNRAPDGTVSPLANRNIDTGMGLERMAQILQVLLTTQTVLLWISKHIVAMLLCHSRLTCPSAQPPSQQRPEPSTVQGGVHMHVPGGHCY